MAGLSEETGLLILKELKSIGVRLDVLEARVSVLEKQMESVIEMLVRHDNSFKNFITRDEFEEFVYANASQHDAMMKRIEHISIEFIAFQNVNMRLDERLTSVEDDVAILKVV
ncbi:MAG: hypothetical protein WC897_03955 [Candidatus Gracilibacteria bacterium]